MTILVTGGGGFLGGAVARLLHARGDRVRSLTRSAYPWLSELGIEQAHGDLADADAVAKAVAGVDAVIHTAAKAGVWGRWADYHSTNITGTENLLNACRDRGVRTFVYTGTPSVVHSGGDITGGDESLPYGTHFLSHYAHSKCRAEQKVIAANTGSLLTVALRPHLIWGPGDPHLIPRVLARARAGKLRRVGRRPVTVDATYIDNAATAHVNALDALQPGAACAGRAYFITNGEPVLLWDFLNRILADAGLPPATRSVPAWAASLVGRVSERMHKLFRLAGEPAMTRFVASQLSTSHWFDITAAKRDLNYHPTVTMEEGLKRLAATLK